MVAAVDFGLLTKNAAEIFKFVAIESGKLTAVLLSSLASPSAGSE